MNSNSFAQMNVTQVLTIGDLGLDRRASAEETGDALARVAEAQIVRWVQFPAGILFFTLALVIRSWRVIHPRSQDRCHLLVEFR